MKAQELAADGGVPVLCTHGDVIWGMVELLEKTGAYLPGPVDVKKGSVWVLEIESGSDRIRQVHPPGQGVGSRPVSDQQHIGPAGRRSVPGQAAGSVPENFDRSARPRRRRRVASGHRLRR